MILEEYEEEVVHEEEQGASRLEWRRGRTHDLVILCMGCTVHCEHNVQVIQSGDGGAH